MEEHESQRDDAIATETSRSDGAMTLRQMILNLLAIATVVVLPHLGLTPNFSYSIPILLFVWLFLRRTGEGFSDIGFRFRSCTLRAALFGSIAAVAILSFMQLLVFPALDHIVELESNDIGLYEFVRANKTQFLIIVVMGWLIGGLYEEIVFHGFIFTRLEKMIPGKNATALSFSVSCIVFGAYHLQMGSAGAFNALVVGSVYQGLFLYFDRNLWASIICHGVYNTMVLTLIYMGYL